jgi:hypothetical protein
MGFRIWDFFSSNGQQKFYRDAFSSSFRPRAKSLHARAPG